MRRNPARLLLPLLLLAPLLAGCLERGQPTMVDSSGDDDAFCRGSHAVGSPDYGAGIVVGWKGHSTVQYGVPLPDQPRGWS